MRFRSKILVLVTCVLAVCTAVCSAVLITGSFRASLAQEKDRAAGAYDMILYTLDAVHHFSRSAEITLSDALAQLDEQPQKSWCALELEQDGYVLYGEADDTMTTDQLAPEVRRIQYLLREDSTLLRISGTLSQNGVVYVLRADFDVSGPFEERERQLRAFTLCFACVLFCGAIAAWLLAGILTRPLSHLSRTAKQIAGGDLTTRSQISSHDEVGALAGDFNVMADTLASKIRALEDEGQRRDRFMGSFAHEMKTPLTAIIGYAELLQGGGLTPGQKDEALSYIRGEGLRLENLSHKFLDLLILQKQDFDFQNIDLASLASSVAGEMQAAFSKHGVALCAEGNGVLSGDEDLLRSLVINLLDNALKATSSGGRVTLRFSPKLLSVEDTGRGIPAEDLEKVCEAFYRVDRSRSRKEGGVGLGLALCSSIASVHGGKIRMESKTGEGTRVSVSFWEVRK